MYCDKHTDGHTGRCKYTRKDTYTRTGKHTYLLLISMLWHRQAIFKSKGDKLCSSAECRIWTRGPRHQIASRLNARWQTDWAIEDQAKNLNALTGKHTYIHTGNIGDFIIWIWMCCYFTEALWRHKHLSQEQNSFHLNAQKLSCC